MRVRKQDRTLVYGHCQRRGIEKVQTENVQTDKRERRRRQIHAAAYTVLERKGYKAASMLAIAKEAKASNETLYAWYGNKEGLFRTLIEENAAHVAEALTGALDTGQDVGEALPRVGALLLELVTGDRAIALNRAAAADATDTGELGRSLAAAGRDSIAPLLERLFERAREDGTLSFGESDRVTEVYIGLLIGDTQIRRTTGAVPAPSPSERRDRADRAAALFLRLFSA